MKVKLPSAFAKRFSVPKEQQIISLFKKLSPSERLVFVLLGSFFVISTLALIQHISERFLVEVPARGGSLSEGIIGSPRFINPLLAISDADRDLTTLVYSGLTRATPEGDIIPDLAESFTISDDGLTYLFTLKENLEFHDGTRLTARDVVFTIQKTQDPSLKSPKRANWDGIFVEMVSEREIRFTLRQPYAPFLQNTTIGILPEHIWKDIDSENFSFSQFNSEPIGSGPYKVTKIKRDRAGIPEYYVLKSNSKYALGQPYLTKLTLYFYPSEDKEIEAYHRGEIDSLNSIPFAKIPDLGKKAEITKTPLPRVFGVFFNQNQAEIFTHKEVRLALDRAIDKEKVVNDVLLGYGTPISSPLPPNILSDQPSASDSRTPAEILEENGWKKNDEGLWQKGTKNPETLRFTLATTNTAELKQTAQLLKEQWESLGVPVDVQIFEPGDLSQNVIRPRRYDALLFGEIVGRDLDLFAFWHSSQRNDPGLNIALYTNITTDKLLEEARTTFTREELITLFAKFEKEVVNDIPAAFVYSPDFIYVIPTSIQGVRIGSIATPSERFLNIHEWHTQTEKVWYFLR